MEYAVVEQDTHVTPATYEEMAVKLLAVDEDARRQLKKEWEEEESKRRLKILLQSHKEAKEAQREERKKRIAKNKSHDREIRAIKRLLIGLAVCFLLNAFASVPAARELTWQLFQKILASYK